VILRNLCGNVFYEIKSNRLGIRIASQKFRFASLFCAAGQALMGAGGGRKEPSPAQILTGAMTFHGNKRGARYFVFQTSRTIINSINYCFVFTISKSYVD
jgi:hypothetical protein